MCELRLHADNTLLVALGQGVQCVYEGKGQSPFRWPIWTLARRLILFASGLQHFGVTDLLPVRHSSAGTLN